ncbi:MAG: antitoxin component YwqK of YwqJK toxin-antitoxin module [Kiritimatiellia bacterium]
MGRARRTTLLLLSTLAMLPACNNSRDNGPIGERIRSRSGQMGWTAPTHQCAGADSHTVPQDNGSIIQTCSVNGVLQGRFVTWYASGGKAQEGTYTQGQRTGDWVWWHTTGKLATKGGFQSDRELGEWVWWHPNGQTQARGDHIDGRRAGLWSTWFATGQKQSEGQYQNGVKEGRWTYWTADGEPQRTETWRGGQLTEALEPQSAR